MTFRRDKLNKKNPVFKAIIFFLIFVVVLGVSILPNKTKVTNHFAEKSQTSTEIKPLSKEIADLKANLEEAGIEYEQERIPNEGKEYFNFLKETLDIGLQKIWEEILKEKKRIESAGLEAIEIAPNNKYSLSNLFDGTKKIKELDKVSYEYHKKKLISLSGKNIKLIIDKNIDKKLEEHWKVVQKLIPFLGSVQAEKIEINKKVIDLNVFKKEREKKKPSHFKDVNTLKELKKISSLSVEDFRKKIFQVIEKRKKINNYEKESKKNTEFVTFYSLGGVIFLLLLLIVWLVIKHQREKR